MKDNRNTKHKGCGGTIKEVNIFEELACDKCRQGIERYTYTKTEQIANLTRERDELKRKYTALAEELNRLASRNAP